jgi:multiple sugar transport system ATP-binding protein
MAATPARVLSRPDGQNWGGAMAEGSRFSGLERVTVLDPRGTAVLRDLTLLAAPGELLAVLGPSGSGKTTLLRAVAGLAPVRSGEILIGGQQVTGLPVPERHVSMVFEAGALVPFLDVARNLAWGLKAQHVASDEVKRRVSAQAQRLHLSRLLSRMPKGLSAGERGMVGVGRALVQVPSVFLLDEPLAHLDAAERWQTCRRIVDVVKGLNVTTFYVTHDQGEALAIADRLAVLNDGSVVQIGSPREVYQRPVSIFVAGFIGSPPIGLLPARPVESGGTGAFQVGTRTLPLWVPLPAALRDLVDRPVVLGVRPEDIHDAREGIDPRLVALNATVTAVEYTGREDLVTVELPVPAVASPGADPSEAGAQRAQVRARFSPTEKVRPGDEVQLAIDVVRAHVFDVTTGQALHHPPDDEPDS